MQLKIRNSSEGLAEQNMEAVDSLDKIRQQLQEVNWKNINDSNKHNNILEPSLQQERGKKKKGAIH